MSKSGTVGASLIIAVMLGGGTSVLKYATALQDAALSWLDSGVAARLIVDMDFRIFWANTAARTALKRRSPIEDRDGVFMLSNGTAMALLDAEAANLGEKDTFVQSVSTEDGVDFVIVVRVLSDCSSDERFYGIELRSPNEAATMKYGGYRSCFGVTQAEDRVLQELLKGHNVEKCAAVLDISVDTVRSHIRQLYSKMNVSSREALFSAMIPFRLQ